MADPANAAIVVREPSPVAQGAKMNAREGEQVVLLRIYGAGESTSHRFAIQTQDGKLLGADRRPLPLKEGTYDKCYNSYKFYGDNEGVSPFDKHLKWEGEPLRNQYMQLKYGSEMRQGDTLVLIAAKGKGGNEELQVVKVRGGKRYGADGKEVKGDIEWKMYLGDEKVLGTLMEGRLSMALAKEEFKNYRIKNDGFMVQPAAVKKSAPAASSGGLAASVNVTGYFSPDWNDYVGKNGVFNKQKFDSAVELQGSGLGRDGWVDYLGNSIDGPNTSSGTIAKKGYTIASSNSAYQEKYAVVMRDGKVIFSGKVEDTGGGLASDQLDLYQGVGKEAKERAHAITGAATAYFFDTETEMRKFATNKKGTQA